MIPTREIRDLPGLISFIHEMANLIDEGGIALENSSTASYIEALSAFLEDSNGYYTNLGVAPESIDIHRRVADALYGATIYE